MPTNGLNANSEVPSPRLNTRRRTNEYAERSNGEQHDRERQVERQVGELSPALDIEHRPQPDALDGLDRPRRDLDVDDPRQPPLDAGEGVDDAEEHADEQEADAREQ